MTIGRGIQVSLALLALAALPGARAGQLELDNGHLSIRLSDSGSILSLRDPKRSREWIAPGDNPLYRLEFSRGGDAERLTVSSQDARKVTIDRSVQDGWTTARLRFAGPPSQPVEVTVSIAAKPGDPMLRCRLAVAFPDGLALESVRFPLIHLKGPAAGGADDALVFGSTKGGVHRNPTRQKPGWSVSAGQPGNLAAQFGCYYDRAGGIYTAALDARGFRKTISASRTANGLALSWLEPCLDRGKHVQSYDIVLGAFAADEGEPTDWRHAADLYKAWAVRQPWCARTLSERTDLPGWLRQGPAMVRFGREWLAEPKRIEAWLSGYWKKRFPVDVPLVAAYWGWEKVATWVTPDYFPVYPSDEQFRSLVAFSRPLGVHAFLWPSGYHYTLTYGKRPDGTFLWDDRARFDALARPHAVVGRDGKTLIGDRSWLQGGQTATLCGGDPWTIDWFNRIGRQLAERGAEMVQVDQVVGGAWPVCYSDRHGHAPGAGDWPTVAFRRQLQTLREACRAAQPDAVVCFEEPNEHFIQEVGIQDYRDWEVMRNSGAEPASVFNYLYHEYLPTFQSNPRAGDRLMAAYCLASGQMPHLVPARAAGPGPLLEGGGFEESGGASPAGWARVEGYQGRIYSGKSARDSGQFHSGQASLRLHNTAPGEIVQVSQNVAVGGAFAVGRSYRLSAWIKTEDLKNANAIGLATFTQGMKSTGSWRIALPRGSQGWTRGEARFTVPPGSELLRIMLHMAGPGTAWIDDVKLQEERPDGTLAEVARPETPPDHGLMRRWVELYHGAGRPYLFLGTMLHPPKLVTGTADRQGRRFPAILHNAFAAPDGTQAVVLVNPTDSTQAGELSWKGKKIALRLEPEEVRLLGP